MPCPRRHPVAAAPSQASWSRGRRRASSSLAVSCKAPLPLRPRPFHLCPAACRRHHCHYCYLPASLRAALSPQLLAAIGSRPAFVKEEGPRLRNSMFIVPQSPATALTRAILRHKQERVSRLTEREGSNLQRIRHGILFPWPAVPPGQRCVPGLLEQPALSAQDQQQT